MLIHLIVGAIVPALVLGYVVVPCPDHLPINAPSIDIEIQGCSSSPCHFARGAGITYELLFFAAENTPRMQLAATLTVFGIETRIQFSSVQLPPKLKNACNTIVGGCPVVKGQILTRRATIPLPRSLGGGTPALLKIYISDGHGSYSTCTMVNIVVH